MEKSQKKVGVFSLKWPLLGLLIMFYGCTSSSQKEESAEEAPSATPNFVVIFADDMGYGDLGVYGHPTIKTPNLDKMAYEGQKWTNFYVAANVCTPSRACLLTGRYAVRNGMTSNKRWVLFPDSDGGLPQTEITIAKALKGAGYATAAVGKWHLGHLPQYLPTSHGFDSYFGIPYSNDMDRVSVEGGDQRKVFMDPKVENFNVPLMRNEEIVERPADQNTITKRYTEEAVKFITDNKDKPFFLYLAHNLPHVPLFTSDEFRGTSERGLYGDVIEEIDWSAGQIVETLKKLGIDKNTLVVFTSDNGPWVIFNSHGGSSGSLYGAKGTSYEGGQREPAIFWWPGTVKPNVVSGIGSTLDILPTFASLAGVELPQDRTYDGYDLSPVLKSGASSPRNEMIYYHQERIFAARKGDYKLYFYKNNPAGYPEKLEKLTKYQLFNLSVDPSEKYDVIEENPQIAKEIEEMVAQHEAGVEPVLNQLEKRIGEPLSNESK
ncbi:MAG: sulfatase [Imperialibacter sp.]|uniref:sulfatase family protein n=1 Tax=Imperialibacter sp. TaxID=2038411 RepID=UPI003A87BA9B